MIAPRLFLATHKIFSGLVAGGLAAYEGFWLGILGRDAVDRLNLESYRKTPTYLSDAYNRQGLSGWETKVVQEFFPKIGSIVVAAAGAGRETFALAKLGFIVDAFDCCDALVQHASDHPTDGVAFTISPPNQVPPLTRSYSAAIIGWGGYGHIGSRERRIPFLKDMARLIEPGAPLLLSFLERPAPSRSDSIRHVTARLFSTLVMRRALEPGDRIRMDTHPTFIHLFSREEIERELADAGLEVLAYRSTPEPHCVARRLRS